MSKDDTAAIILAAGKGTRMKSGLHKVLHPIGGRPMVGHVLETLKGLGVARRVMVIGAGKAQLERAFPDVPLAVQEPQLGTGHAVLAAEDALGPFDGIVLILYGDVPLVTAETLQKMIDELRNGPEDRAMTVLGFRPQDPAHYGRLVVDSGGNLLAIVEYKDASASQRAIRLCNSGLMAVKGEHLFKLLHDVGNDNAAGEYYLTDIVGLADKHGLTAYVVEGTEAEVQGVNSRVELAEAEAAFQDKKRRQAMLDGATLIDPASVTFHADTVIGRDVVIEPHVVFGPGVTVEDDVTIKAFSHLEGCRVRAAATVGPYARLRPGADIGSKAKIGNFVEIKKAAVGEGAKVNHLSYIGDASIGKDANIGAGTITCNYDGFLKYKTEIGAGAFIGSNSALVAPVKIGDGAIVGAGSVVTKDVAGDALAVARGKQEEYSGWAKTFRQRMAAKKAEKSK